MNFKPIRNEIEYDKALKKVDELMELNPKLDTSLSDKLEILVLLIEKYKKKKWAINELDQIETIKRVQ